MKPNLFNRLSLLVVLALLLTTSGTPVTAQAKPSLPIATPESPRDTASRAPAAVTPSEATQAHVRQSFGQLPLYFVENQGQLDERVAYTIQGSDKTIYFTPDGVTFALTERPLRATNDEGRMLASRGEWDPRSEIQNQKSEIQRWAVKLDFVGANPNVRPIGQDKTEAVISYFKGPQDQWHAGLPTYARILYPDLWPGIDLVYYGTVNQLKYEFIVHPGADPSQIRLAYRGATEVTLNAAGQMQVTTPLGGFTDDTPLAYQEMDGQRIPVSMAYSLTDGASDASAAIQNPQPPEKGDSEIQNPKSYGFSVGSYDPTRPLILDPAILVYCGYIGGSGDDMGNAIAVDGARNAYVTGQTESTEATFPVVSGPDLTYNGYADAFVAKVNAAGSALVYAGYIGGSNGDDDGVDVAVDGAGNAYVTGSTQSTEATFPVVGGPDLIYNGGTYDAFVAKVRADGAGLVYAGYVGGLGNDWGWGIAVNGAGDAYVTGRTESTQATFPVTVGPDLTYNGAAYDAFVAKVNAAGTALVYAGYIGGSDQDWGNDIAVDSAGNAYVTGRTHSSEATFPVVGGPDLTFNSYADAFVTKVNAAGTALVYAGYIGGSGDDWGNGIAVDSTGNAYVTGLTSSTEATFPVTVGPDLTFNGNVDAFVAKVNAAGTALVYAGYIGGASNDTGSVIAVDGAGNAYLTGATNSTEATFPVVGGPDLTYNGGSFYGDAFLAKVRMDGAALVYASYIGGSGYDYGSGIAVDSAGNAYVTGLTQSSEATFPVVGGPDLTHNGGDYDAFVAKVRAEGESICSSMNDTDGDGLPDGWELCGYDADGDGTIDVNLPAMGANPLKKDIFVEIDYMVDPGICILGQCAFGHSHKPKADAINKVVQAFADAPVSNPDGSTGIVLHVEVSDEIPHQDTLQPTDQTWDWSGSDRIKSDQGNFDTKRSRTFHYVVFAHDLGGDIPLSTSGISRNDGGSDAAFRRGASDFVVSLGRWTGGVGSVNEQAGTLMHELGHNLGLRHGGDDHQNYEPNYLSVMNYSFTMSGLIINNQEGALDYSRFGSIPPLNEAHLNETVGLNGGAAIASYGTRYYCRPLSIWQNVRVEHANNAINWDCLLGSGGTDVQANINDGNERNVDSTISTLTGFDDWPALVFDGGDIGPDMGMATRALSAASSIPTEELTFETDSQFYKPYKIAFSGGGDVVASLDVTTTTFITLTNLGALTATVPISYVPGIGWFDLSAAPISVTLTPSASLSIPITLTVPVSRTGAISDSVIISATIFESPLMGDSAALYARIGPLARWVAEPVRGNKPLTVTFGDASVGNITAWLWNLGDGVTSTLPSPTHTYTTKGAYTVTLTVSGPDGSDEEIKAAFIQVYEPVHAAFAASSIHGVAPLVVTFTNQSTGDYATSLWGFGDGVTSTLLSPTHTYNVGIYTVTLTVSGLGGTDTWTRTNYITATGPLAGITVAPNPITVTVGATQTFAASGADAYGNPVSISPTWTTDAGTLTDNILTAQATPANGRHVTATVGSVSGTAVVNVVAGPLTSIAVTPNPVTVTVGATQAFTATGADTFGNAVPISPTWTTDAGTMAGNVLTAQTTPASSRHVTATVGSESGMATVNIAAGPLASINVTPNPVTVTVGATQAFAASGADAYGNAISISPTWSTNAGTMTGNILTAQTTLVSDRLVTATVGSVSGTAVVNIVAGPLTSVTVMPNPITVTVGSTQTFTASGADAFGNAVSISPTWSTDAGTMAGNVLTAQTTPANGRHVTATVGGISGTATVNVAAGLLASITVTPNPVTVTVGATQAFTATGADAFGNTMLISPTWTTDAGTLTDNILTAQITPANGRHVTATVGSVSGTTIVNVMVGPLTSIAVTPNPVMVTVGATQAFTASGADTFGNAILVSPTWSTDAGTMLGNVLTAQTTSANGRHVTATVGTVSGFAIVNIVDRQYQVFLPIVLR